MRVLIINSVCGIASTGRICTNIADEMMAQGHEVVIAYGRGEVPEKYHPIAHRIGGRYHAAICAAKVRLLDNEGYNGRLATAAFLRWADVFNPDLVWLHNIHGYYIHVGMLFEWIKQRKQMKVQWTLHDCWAFTGHCTNFSSVQCEYWKEGCHDCIQTKEYPASQLVDHSIQNYEKKKRTFLGVENMQLFVPSAWLKRIVDQSYLGSYPIKVLPNAINRDVFVPTESRFREEYALENKLIILGVANAWQRSKGFYDLIELSKQLDERYQIVMVGVTEEQKKELPMNILALGRTANQTELAQIYSAADVFVNPSTEETFGMTTLEASLCGTKAIVYRGTACEDTALEYGGIVIDPNVAALKAAIEDYIVSR